MISDDLILDSELKSCLVLHFLREFFGKDFVIEALRAFLLFSFIYKEKDYILALLCLGLLHYCLRFDYILVLLCLGLLHYCLRFITLLPFYNWASYVTADVTYHLFLTLASFFLLSAIFLIFVGHLCLCCLLYLVRHLLYVVCHFHELICLIHSFTATGETHSAYFIDEI